MKRLSKRLHAMEKESKQSEEEVEVERSRRCAAEEQLLEARSSLCHLVRVFLHRRGSRGLTGSSLHWQEEQLREWTEGEKLRRESDKYEAKVSNHYEVELKSFQAECHR